MIEKKENLSMTRMNRYIQALCGLYSRVARKLVLDRSYVSRVARGERHSEEVEKVLTKEFDRIQSAEIQARNLSRQR